MMNFVFLVRLADDNVADAFAGLPFGNADPVPQPVNCVHCGKSFSLADIMGHETHCPVELERKRKAQVASVIPCDVCFKPIEFAAYEEHQRQCK